MSSLALSNEGQEALLVLLKEVNPEALSTNVSKSSTALSIEAKEEFILFFQELGLPEDLHDQILHQLSKNGFKTFEALKVALRDKALLEPILGRDIFPVYVIPKLREMFQKKITLSTIDDIQRFHEEGLAYSTLVKYHKVIKWYEGLHEDNDIQNEDGAEILNKAIRFLLHDPKGKALKPSTKFTKIETLMAVCPLLKKPLEEDDAKQCRRFCAELHKLDDRGRAAGEYGVLHPITPMDLRHIFQVLHYRSNGSITTKDLQLFFKLSFACNSSRRASELHTLAPADFELLFERDADGNILSRKLVYTWCYMKGYGPGVYKGALLESQFEYVEMNCIVLLLALLERMGAIRSAVAVYEGHEKLAIDKNRFEDAESLVVKLKKSLARKSVSVMKSIKCRTGGSDSDDDSVVEWDEQDWDLDEDDMNIIVDVAKLDKPGDPLPLFTAIAKRSYAMSCTCSTRNEKALSDLANASGYLGRSKDLRFGLQNCRRTFVNEKSSGCEAFGLFSDFSNHNTMYAGHSKRVADKNYIQQNEQRIKQPGNMAATWVCGTGDFCLPPAYTRDGFFCSQVKPFKNPLPFESPQDLLTNLLCKASSITDIVRDEDGVVALQECPVVGCGEKFYYLGDLHDHDKRKHRKSHERACGCGLIFKKKGNYETHIKECEDPENLFYVGRNPGATKPPESRKFIVFVSILQRGTSQRRTPSKSLLLSKQEGLY